MRKSLGVFGLAIALWTGSAFAQTPPAGESEPDRPPGFVGRSMGHPRPIDTSPDFVPIPDRWRLGLPNWNRYERPLEAPFVRGRWWDPYNQNVLKGDFPILGQNIFLSIVGHLRHPVRGPPPAHAEQRQLGRARQRRRVR